MKQLNKMFDDHLKNGRFLSEITKIF